MVAYKLKVMHDEDDTLYLLPMRHIRNAYPREENNCGDDSVMFLIDERHMGGTIISKNTDLRSNNVPESRYLVLSYLHISGAKYRI